MADPPLADDDDDMEAFSSEAVVNPSIASSATIASDGQLNSNSSSVESAETAISRQQDDYEKAAEEYRLAKETERGKEEELEKERQAEIRRKSREEEEERKRVKRLQREEEQRQLAINQATSTRRRILSMQQNIKNDKLICAGWSKGKTGEEALGRQIHGLWKVGWLEKGRAGDPSSSSHRTALPRHNHRARDLQESKWRRDRHWSAT